MTRLRNILFIMYDQLRFDYLGCTGHPTLKTPNFDRLAARGVIFERSYVQSPVCGASRMSFYTGRYVDSHGAAWNNFPLKVGELTLGDHLRAQGMDSWLIGKTHMKADAAGMARLGLAPDSVIGARVAECGFDVWTRDDGLWAEGPDGFYDARRSPYNEWLKQKGYASPNPWHDHANSGRDAGGDFASGWLLQSARHPADIDERDSETPWLTDQAIAFLDSPQAQSPWMCHLSFIKPHWPYVVPAPYHALYGAADVLPARRHPQERDDPHPVYGAFMANPMGQAFSRDEVRETVIPAYMGLIAQCDAELGRLLDHLEATGRMEDTMIVVTSDHGDYLGDHWLGEKDLFHDPSVRVPMILYHPDCEATRGTTCPALVEGIDLAATFVDALGVAVPGHILEGRSLMPWLRGETPAWRDAVISEYDYSATVMAAQLGIAPKDARLVMVCDGRFKMMDCEGGLPPMLFDLQADPDEFHDLGRDPAHEGTRARLRAMIARWARRGAQRTTISDAEILARRGKSRRKGVFLGVWDKSDLPEDLHPYVGPARDRAPGG